MNIRTIKFPFDNNRGKKLAGIIDLPQGEPLLYGVFSPCFTCTKESHGAHKVCRALAGYGIAMLRFDLTGLGESEGVFAETNFSTRIQDIVAACDALGNAYQSPKLLIGHSISGTAAIAASEQLSSLEAVATLGAPSDPSHIVEGLRRSNAIAISGEDAEMIISGRKIRVKKQMIDNMSSYMMINQMEALSCKLFIFHAPHDDIVSYKNAQIIYDRAINANDKELVTLKQSATHLLERGGEDADFIANTLYHWFYRHLQN